MARHVRLLGSVFVTLLLLLNSTLPLGAAASYDNASTVLEPTASAPSSKWITVASPFTGDANRNSYATYEYATTPVGPWTRVCSPGVPGDSEWRACAFSGLTPDTDYFVRVTFVDPDGVIGGNPWVLGPVHTQADSHNETTINSATVTSEDTYMLANLDIAGDDNTNSTLSVDLALSPSGPWSRKCGPPPSFYGPQLCRITGLVTGTSYFVRFTVSDPDGVVGDNPQIVGPVTYTGLTDLALNKPISADPGWGCCPNPSALVDGLIQYPNWPYGFAWCGGTANWGGCGPGIKHAAIDLGTTQTVARLDAFTHDAGNVPLTWKVELSNDNVNYTTAYTTSAPQCRTATMPLQVGWGSPTCGQVATFTPTSARYVRYSFDDTTLFNGIHGWQVELEVFGAATPSRPTARPASQAGSTRRSLPGSGPMLPTTTRTAP